MGWFLSSQKCQKRQDQREEDPLQVPVLVAPLFLLPFPGQVDMDEEVAKNDER